MAKPFRSADLMNLMEQQLSIRKDSNEGMVQQQSTSLAEAG
jgi:hypothetical protein